MAEEIDENGFYREDFSIESDWEVFNAQLADIFQRWGLTNAPWGREFEPGELFCCQWHVQTETLRLLRNDICVSYYEAQLKPFEQPTVAPEEEQSPLYQDLMSLNNTFGMPHDGRTHELHPLARLYGLRRFIIMHPRQMHLEFLTNPAEFSFFLSAAAVVLAEICTNVPMFVQIYDPKWNFYVGVATAPSLRTNFDLVALEQAPLDCRYLSGLLAMFKEKLPATYMRSATLSVRNTYALDTICMRIPLRIPFAKPHATEDEEDGNTVMLRSSQFSALPDGYFPDACTEMLLTYTWPEIAENLAIDSALRSDFVPSKAPFGSICLKVKAKSYLSSCIRDYLNLNGNNLSLESFLGRNYSGTASAANSANPLDSLTKSRVRNLHMKRQKRSYTDVKRESPPRKLPGPMNDNELNQMLFYLFPDMHPDVALFNYDKKNFLQEFDSQRIKSAAPDSLVCRLSCLLTICNAHFGGKSGMAQLWATFTRELRYLWDSCVTIPGVAPGFPDTRTCLLHQKLQMLNVCMERCENRIPGAKGDAPNQVLNASITSDEDETEEDEFYDCEESGSRSASGSPINANRPEGRQQCFGDLKLLDSDELLYIPATQEPVPKTEDQLQSDAEAMLRLGPGSDVTSEMMCSALRSDMEAFKAANPKAQLADFIRWYSPKDWEETTNDEGIIEGTLSPRMLVADNTWQRMWQQAQPVPVWRQRRLFDDTTEALKVLHYLDTRSIGEIFQLTVVPMLHSAVLKLKDIFSDSDILDMFSAEFQDILTPLCRLSRELNITASTEDDSIDESLYEMEVIIKKIETLETHFYQYKCYAFLAGYPGSAELSDVKRQFKEILKNNGSYSIINRREGESEGGIGGLGKMPLQNCTADMHENLVSKDYVIRVDGETTSSSKGRAGPQFLRAIVTGDTVRLCGAFTENTTFV